MKVYRALAKYLKVSPFKVRPVIDLIRGHSVSRAITWLRAHPNRRTTMVLKVVVSAVANAIDLSGKRERDYKIAVAKVDNGPTQRYAIPGAMGRSVMRRRRFSHIEICVQPLNNENFKEMHGGTKS